RDAAGLRGWPRVVGAGRVGEAGEAPQAAAGKEAGQDEEVRRVAEEAVDERDGRGVWRRRIEALAGEEPAEGHREGQGAERRELAPERPPAPHQCTCSARGRGPVSTRALKSSTHLPPST